MATDNFDRADSSSTLGANWTAATGTWGIFGNDAYAPTPGAAYYSGASFTGNHYAQATAGTFYSAQAIAPAVRVQANGDAYVLDNGHLYKSISGVPEDLGNTGVGFVTGDVIKLEADGTTIKVYKNGAEVLSVTNAVLSGGSPGMYGSSPSVTLNDWSGADNVGGGPSGPPAGTLGLLGVGV